jgi:HAD superfamily hydrolase (TIGR01549 family)
MDSLVIFDVDGVLLELTAAEEDAFFDVFARRYAITGLSRDWDSYRIRNDQDIIDEILEVHGKDPAERQRVIADYLHHLAAEIAARRLTPIAIAGARELLAGLTGVRLGVATANLLGAAQLRLDAVGLWRPVSRIAAGAEGGGPKRAILARAIAAAGLPKERIVFVGDNLQDVDAGLANGVHFIGFSTNEARRTRLAAAGARHLAGDHDETRRLIANLLS